MPSASILRSKAHQVQHDSVGGRAIRLCMHLRQSYEPTLVKFDACSQLQGGLSLGLEPSFPLSREFIYTLDPLDSGLRRSQVRDRLFVGVTKELRISLH